MPRIAVLIVFTLVFAVFLFSCESVNVKAVVGIYFGTPTFDEDGLWIDVTISNESDETNTSTGDIYFESYSLTVMDEAGREVNRIEEDPNIWLAAGSTITYTLHVADQDTLDGLPSPSVLDLTFIAWGKDEDDDFWTVSEKNDIDI